MKKYILFSFIAILFSVFSSSCTKQERSIAYDTENTAFVVPDQRKTGVLYSISVQVGHTAAQCPNGCIHLPGGSYHVDCQGWGNACTQSASLFVVPVAPSLFTGTTQDSTDLTGEEFFNMPDRSLYLGLDGGKPLWLNIPAQLSIRDSVTRVFTFSGLYYSSKQVYQNL